MGVEIQFFADSIAIAASVLNHCANYAVLSMLTLVATTNVSSTFSGTLVWLKRSAFGRENHFWNSVSCKECVYYL